MEVEKSIEDLLPGDIERAGLSPIDAANFYRQLEGSSARWGTPGLQPGEEFPRRCCCPSIHIHSISLCIIQLTNTGMIPNTAHLLLAFQLKNLQGNQTWGEF
ncbi:hypothetical protein O6H91_Y041000 [Diphasiastrum complanatum]|nr:hypothetical protein O6H91_Y041000 [Diphasiastrum complanatum]